MRIGVRLAASLGLVLVFALSMAGVKSTNLGGYEWPMINVAAQGIADEPYGNRPLGLLWHLPPALLWPDSFAGYWRGHLVYSCFAGILFYSLCVRVAPNLGSLAWLAAVFSLTWAPLDHARLDSIPAIVYSGATLGTLVALRLFVESWLLGRVGLLAAAGVVVLVVSRASEATLPVFVGAPILLWCRTPADGRHRSRWVAGWGVAVAAGFGLALVSMLNGGGYQSGMGFDPHPLRVLVRLLLQFRFHLAPLATAPADWASSPWVIAATLVFLAFWAGISWKTDDATAPVARPGLRPLGLGLFFAALAYGGPIMASAYVTPERMQILSGPGIGLALAAAACGVASLWPRGPRRAVIGALGAWIVASGTAHTLAVQRDWDTASAFPRQRALLAQLVATAPDVAPNTLFVLVDEAPTFPASFSFRHAVAYLYPGHATGITGDGADLLYPATFTPVGVQIEPIPVLRRPWREPPTIHRYDEIVVLEHRAGRLSVLEEWPEAALPRLPKGARYAPLARFRPELANVPSRTILTRP